MTSLPRKEDYQRFMDLFVGDLSKNHPDVCFYTFGSSDTKNVVYGRSDIDGGIILNSKIITDKDVILDIANILADALSDTHIDTQFNLLDLDTIRDGRFMSYTTDFTDYIKESGRVRSVPNFVQQMNGKNFKSGVLYTASFNFSGPSGVRNALLNSIAEYDKNQREFISSVKKALDKTAKFPKKLIWLRKGVIIPSKQNAKKELETMLEDINLDTLEKISNLLDDPSLLYKTLSNSQTAINLLCDSLECMELMINEYIKKFPQVGERELKE